MKKIAVLLVLLTSLEVRSQPFVDNLKILTDTTGLEILEIKISGGNDSRKSPRNLHCINFNTRIDGEGKVLVELLDSTQKRVWAFFGNLQEGNINACFHGREISIKGGSLFYKEERLQNLRIREPKDDNKKFRYQ